MVSVGIDEVGRGCWAGPVVAGAVILSRPLKGIKDSKLLTRAKREEWALIIEKSALSYGIGWSTPAEVDELGLTEAIRQAMSRALSQITANYDEIIIDGNYNFLDGNSKTRTIIKADMTIQAVSAASILAKVARDHHMIELSPSYPDYGFENHVGYGTPLHLKKLKDFGVTEIHRRSYAPIKALLELST